MLFKDIKGQDRAIDFLKAAVANNTLAQGYIFLGPKGTGKFTTALSFAKALNCASGKAGACGECGPCRKIEAKNHPDFIVIRPSSQGDREIEIDAVRALKYMVNLKPYELRTKVCVIDGADRMNPAAANALLKTLEEPPANSVLILIVENLSNILATIASRCQVVKFYSLPLEELENILVKGYALEGSKARYLAHFSSGRLGEAIRLKDENLLDRKNSVIDGLLDGRIFEEEHFTVSKEDAPWILDVMLSWYRDLIMARLEAGDPMLINIDRRGVLRGASSRTGGSVKDLARVATEIVNCRTYLANNVNPKLAWSVLSDKVGSLNASKEAKT